MATTKNRPSVKDVTWYTESTTDGVKVESGDAVWPGFGLFRGCAYRVTVPGKRVKTFWGESAWNSAERYADDERWNIRRGN